VARAVGCTAHFRAHCGAYATTHLRGDHDFKRHDDDVDQDEEEDQKLNLGGLDDVLDFVAARAGLDTVVVDPEMGGVWLDQHRGDQAPTATTVRLLGRRAASVRDQQAEARVPQAERLHDPPAPVRAELRDMARDCEGIPGLERVHDPQQTEGDHGYHEAGIPLEESTDGRVAKAHDGVGREPGCDREP
jgi:hypothetical protein